MSKQYSGYLGNAEIVKQMVDKDDPVLTQQLYAKLSVPYIEDVKVAFEAVASCRTRIACTHIKLLDWKKGDTTKEEYHAVCFVRLDLNSPIYFFDPNGAVDDYSKLKFVLDSTFMTTETLMRNLKRGRPLTVIFGEEDGVQAFAPSSLSSIYVKGGGYCMFYIYIFMEKIISMTSSTTHVNSEIDEIIKHTYSEDDSGIFPNKYNIAKVSKLIVDSVFGANP
jgi:hypothetical protein